MEKIIVTRHPALVELLKERGLITGDEPVLDHVAPADIRGKHVIGVLSLSLASLAEKITEVPLRLTLEDRERGELDIRRLREIAGEPVTYRVEVVE